MKAIAVIGSNYGDEGKGLVTDALVAMHNAGTVVRFNGGAQAGHTVITPDGFRHVFSHLGAGTLTGADTYLSRHFVVNPEVFNAELKVLESFKPKIYVHEDCLVTTPWDVILNQFKEKGRGKMKHGSVGLGIHETIVRHIQRPLAVKDFVTTNPILQLSRIAGDFASLSFAAFEFSQLTQEDKIALKVIRDNESDILQDFLVGIEDFLTSVIVIDKGVFRFPDRPIIFEGAQGLLLDQNMPGVHKTHSNTGLDNVAEICKEEGIELEEVVFVTRPYLTRHGAGPLEKEGTWGGEIVDETNVPNTFQDSLRSARLDWDEFDARIDKELKKVDESVQKSLAVTCCDQIAWPYTAHSGENDYEIEEEDFVSDLKLLGVDNIYLSWGPTRETFFRQE